MEVVERNSALWVYMSEEIRDLIVDGEKVLEFVYKNKDREYVSDYSFLVFPFAKAYEGFLKRFLLDMGLIKEEEYYGDEIRIGRILNPHFIKEKGNVFGKLCSKTDRNDKVSTHLWRVWKRGRNLVFHYFPHNYRKLTYDQALDIINDIIGAMNKAVRKCDVMK